MSPLIRIVYQCFKACWILVVVASHISLIKFVLTKCPICKKSEECFGKIFVSSSSSSSSSNDRTNEREDNDFETIVYAKTLNTNSDSFRSMFSCVASSSSSSSSSWHELQRNLNRTRVTNSKGEHRGFKGKFELVDQGLIRSKLILIFWYKPENTHLDPS